MAASKVYFTTFHTTLEENIQQKLSRLLLTAGMDQIDFKNRYVAIKMHFGEPGNLAYLRPNYAKTVADLVRQLGGKPFLTDCNTLYVGGRKNALDHIGLCQRLHALHNGLPCHHCRRPEGLGRCRRSG